MLNKKSKKKDKEKKSKGEVRQKINGRLKKRGRYDSGEREVKQLDPICKMFHLDEIAPTPVVRTLLTSQIHSVTSRRNVTAPAVGPGTGSLPGT